VRDDATVRRSLSPIDPVEFPQAHSNKIFEVEYRYGLPDKGRDLRFACLPPKAGHTNRVCRPDFPHAVDFLTEPFFAIAR